MHGVPFNRARLLSKALEGSIVQKTESGLGAMSVPKARMEFRLVFRNLMLPVARHDAFIIELRKQLIVAVSGLLESSFDVRLCSRLETADPVLVDVAVDMNRYDQIRDLLSAGNEGGLFDFTPLLRYASIDEAWFPSVTSDSAGSSSVGPHPAPAMLARLDELQRKYSKMKDGYNVIEMYHKLVRAPNPYIPITIPDDDGMESRSVQRPSISAGYEAPTDAIVASSGISDPSVSLTDYSPGQFPKKETIYSDHNELVAASQQLKAQNRPLVAKPPSNESALLKAALDTSLEQFSVNAVELTAASAEIGRRLSQARESAEILEVSQAGLASPVVLDRLQRQNDTIREQQRLLQDLKVATHWEKSHVGALHRENQLKYIRLLNAKSTGDDDEREQVLCESGGVEPLSPSVLRKKESELLLRAMPKISVSNAQKPSTRVLVEIFVDRITMWRPLEAQPADVYLMANYMIASGSTVVDGHSSTKTSAVRASVTSESATSPLKPPSDDMTAWTAQWSPVDDSSPSHDSSATTPALEKIALEIPLSKQILNNFLDLSIWEYAPFGWDVKLGSVRIPLNSLLAVDRARLCSNVSIWDMQNPRPENASSGGPNLNDLSASGRAVVRFNIDCPSVTDLMGSRSTLQALASASLAHSRVLGKLAASDLPVSNFITDQPLTTTYLRERMNDLSEQRTEKLAREYDKLVDLTRAVQSKLT